MRDDRRLLLEETYKDVLPDEPSLSEFMSAMREFDKRFTDAMVEGTDFTFKLEVRGDKSRLIHARCDGINLRRPSSTNGDNS